MNCRSERVKAVDFHPTEPWILSAIYNGTVTIRNYQTNALIKTIEVCDSPVRTVKFIARKNWVITGSDDLMVRVYNYNTLERIAQFRAHGDYIRGLAIHPTRSFVLSCSDDLTIKLWDWDKAWKQVASFEGHSHYVMGIAFNPKDSNTFASVSLDKTIKMWSLSLIGASVSSSATVSQVVSVKPNYTMGDGGSGHEKGINCVDFYGGSDRPYLATGSDDFTVRIWDYHTKSCVRVLEGHGNNVSSALFHPQLPLLLSAGEDGALKIWNAQTFRPEASYSFGMERAWSVACSRSFSAIGLGFDSGTAVVQLGRGDPCASLDLNQGKLVWSRARGTAMSGVHGNEILTGMVRLLDVEGRPVRSPADGEVIPLTPKELGTAEVFPQNLLHSPDGRLVAVWGDGEYVIYSTIGWRNRAFGKGTELVWCQSSSGLGDVFAVRDSSNRVSVNRVTSHDAGMVIGVSGVEKVFGGHLLGLSVAAGTALQFYDWSGEVLVRTIDVEAQGVSWSPSGHHVVIQTEDAVYVLAARQDVLEAPEAFPVGEDGIEAALELVDELEVACKSVCWVSDGCFLYLTLENRLAYHVIGGGSDESFQVALFDRSVFLLGYLGAEDRVYVTDQDLQITSYSILPALTNFQGLVLKGPNKGALSAEAQVLLGNIPSSYHARLAVFLQRRGYLRDALGLSPDADFKFSLALELGELNVARDLLKSGSQASSAKSKWQELGRAALASWNLPMAEESFQRAQDLPALFLIYAAAGDSRGLLEIARSAEESRDQINLAFAAYVKAGARESAFELLMREGRAAEAALFARSHRLPGELVNRAVSGWRESRRIGSTGKWAAALADFSSLPDAFSCEQDLESNEQVYDVFPSQQQQQHRRTRSVSFDGNVSVAGSSTTVSLKSEDEILGSQQSESQQQLDQPTAFAIPVKAADPVVLERSEAVEFEARAPEPAEPVKPELGFQQLSQTASFDPIDPSATVSAPFSSTTSLLDDPSAGTTTSSGSTYASSYVSDDWMSLEVNTAGTGATARLEDLIEESLGEMDDGDEGADSEAPPKGLSIDFESESHASGINVSELDVVEGGADVYDVLEAEFPADEADEEHTSSGMMEGHAEHADTSHEQSFESYDQYAGYEQSTESYAYSHEPAAHDASAYVYEEPTFEPASSTPYEHLAAVEEVAFENPYAANAAAVYFPAVAEKSRDSDDEGNESTEEKQPGGAAAEELVLEEIDFGGDGDAQGWL